MNNLTFGNARYQYYETICSGSPAGPGFDGTAGVHVHMTNTRLTDPEILELRYPVLLEEFSIRRGSGGKGRWRAGDGTLRRIRFLERMDCAILSSFRSVRPFGLEGGEPGECGENWVRRNDGTLERLEGCDQTVLDPGEAIVIKTPTGGGFGVGWRLRPLSADTPHPSLPRAQDLRGLDRCRRRRPERPEGPEPVRNQGRGDDIADPLDPGEPAAPAPVVVGFVGEGLERAGVRLMQRFQEVVAVLDAPAELETLDRPLQLVRLVETGQARSCHGNAVGADPIDERAEVHWLLPRLRRRQRRTAIPVQKHGSHSDVTRPRR
jgi:hypothetical protein